MTRGGRRRTVAAMLDSTQHPSLAPRTAGRVCLTGGAVLVAGALVTQIVQASTTVSDRAWSYPWTSSTAVTLWALWACAQVAVLAGILGLRASGVAGPTRPARVGLALAAAGTALIIVGHLASIPVADQALDDTGPQIVGGVFGLGTFLSAAGLLLAGRATLRAGAWMGWRRSVVLLTGLAAVALMALQFTKLLPTAVAVFELGFVFIGVALAREPAPVADARGVEAVRVA
jgi:hypothetical protein